MEDKVIQKSVRQLSGRTRHPGNYSVYVGVVYLGAGEHGQDLIAKEYVNFAMKTQAEAEKLAACYERALREYFIN